MSADAAGAHDGFGTLYLLPTLLGESAAEDVLPRHTLEVARGMRYVLAENAKSARAFFKAIGHPGPIADITIVEIGHEPDAARIDGWLAPIQRKRIDAALVSEAGTPAVADPGADIVAHAHALGIPVRPLVGPSAVLLALMASGLGGQNFRFAGYLPRAAPALVAALRELERRSRSGETQLFIETPYRNARLFDVILETCASDTRLALALELTTTQETIATRTISAWRQLPPVRRPRLDRRPAVFALLAAGRDTTRRLARDD